MSPFRGQYPNPSPDTACIENRGNGTSVFRDVLGRTRTEVQALPTASLLSCERNDVIEPRQQWGAYGERCSLKMDKATAPPLGSYIYPFRQKERRSERSADRLPYRSEQTSLTLLPRNLRLGQRFSEISCPKIEISEICTKVTLRFRAQ